MQLISSKVHGILDYMMGAGLIAEPYLEGGGKRDGATLLQAAGGAAIASSLFTKYEPSLVKAIPYKTHLVLDIVAGLGLIATAFYLDKRNAHKYPHLYAGILEVLVALGSFDYSKGEKENGDAKSRPSKTPARRRTRKAVQH
jgi:hypothetical protein